MPLSTIFGGRRKNKHDENGSGGQAAGPNEDDEWSVGGRYRIKRAIQVYESRDLKGKPLCELGAGDIILLLTIWGGGPTSGLVVPQNQNEVREPGWIKLEEPGQNGRGAVERKKMEDSWEMRARYTVNHPATLREGPSLTSDQVDEVEQGEEVLVLELGLTTSENEGRARLRAHVSTDKGKIGWLSPENGQGDHLLEPVNLLGPKIVEIHRKSLSASPGGAIQPRKSFNLDSNQVAWERDGQYRVLEKIPLSPSEPNGKSTVNLPPGCLVTINEIKISEARFPDGMAPKAYVTVDSGNYAGKQGWVNLSAKDGHDLVDSRNQKEFEKVVEKLRQSQMGNNGYKQDTQEGSNSHSRQESGSEEGSDEESGSSEDAEEQTGGSQPGGPKEEATRVDVTPRDQQPKPHKGGTPQLERLEEFSGREETRPITEGAHIEDRQQWCNCRCTR